MKNNIKEQIWYTVIFSIHVAIGMPCHDKVDSHFHNDVLNKVKVKVNNQLWALTWTNVGEQVENLIRRQLDEKE